ncbi:MAG: hypothetical protein ABSD75_11290 [Terriglobales bacterium]
MTHRIPGGWAVVNPRWILFLPLAAMAAVLAGCSSGSTANVQNPPPPTPSNVSIAWQSVPGGSLAVGFSENLTAVVSNDPNNPPVGVDWALTCQADPHNQLGLCGSLSAVHTPSGTPTTYTAPTTITGNSTAIQIVAYATADPTKNQLALITISTFNSSLQAGNYVLEAQGVDANLFPYQFAGVIALDGQGDVTGGELTVNSGGTSTAASITPHGSSYFIGNDGRGTINLVWSAVANPNSTGTETFALVFLNNSRNPQALISEIDSFSATGTMDLQQAATIAPPSGSYAFVMSGTDVIDSLPLAFGGVFNIPSGQTTLSGVTDELIASHQKVSDGPFLTGSQLSSGPDAFGQVTFTLIGLLDASHPKPVTAVLTGYIVDSGNIKLIESDTAGVGSIAAFATTGGFALAQASGSFGTFNSASLSGSYVFGITGVDLSINNSGYSPSTWTQAGSFSADGQNDGALSNGFTDSFLQLNCVQSTCITNGTQGAQISAAFTGTYAVDASGSGRTTLTGFNFSPTPVPAYSPELFLYLTGNGTQGPAALVLGGGNLGPGPNQHYPSIGTGVAYAQNGSIAFAGDYGFRFTQQNGSENDGTAQINANSANTPAVSGIADANIGGGVSTDNGFLGGFSTPNSGGPFAGTLYANPNAQFNAVFPLAPSLPMAVNYYPVDADHGFWIETDLVSQATAQVSFGIYAARTPVCASGCP